MTGILRRPDDEEHATTAAIPVPGLRRYAAEVASAFGVSAEECSVDPGPPASVYLALTSKLPHDPGRDLVLLWDEHRGWAAALTSPRTGRAKVVAYRGGDLVPYPADVTAFVGSLVSGQPLGQKMAPHSSTAARDEMIYRLVGWAR